MKFFLKALKVLAVVVGLVLIAWLGFYLYGQQQRAAFLQGLKGEIVFMRRDGQFNKIYKISANGQNEKLVFANDDEVNSNSMEPKWSDDGSKISFTAMKDGKWQTFTVNPDGGDLQISEPVHDTTSMPNLPDDLKIDKGSLYVKEGGGRETLVYGFNRVLYDRVFAPGAQNASWSPDKQYVIFESGYFAWGDIMIADRDGKNAVRLTEGRYADWK